MAVLLPDTSDHDQIITFTNSFVQEWTLVKTPVPIFSIVGFYLLFVLYLGPQWMKNRKAYDLKPALKFYNVFQIIFNLLVIIVPFIWLPIPHFVAVSFCKKLENQLVDVSPIAVGVWFYYMAKIIDLFDTVFMVLKKKQNQITFLHVMHHAAVPVTSYIILRYSSGIQGAIPLLLNSAIHVIMYSYYLLASLGPDYAKYIWWKQYLTSFQIVQFLMILTYLTYVTFTCQFPIGTTALIGANVVLFLVLFLQFYKKSYGKTK